MLGVLAVVLAVGTSAADAKVSNGTVAADPCNQYLAIQVGSDARFNEGAFPDTSTCGTGTNSFNLSFDWPGTPGTSFSTVQVDGNNYVYGTDGTVISPPTDSGLTDQSSWQITPGVKVSQTLSIVNGPSTGNPDTAQITYSITNTDTVSHQVGLRVMIDTMLNGNDGAPFYVPGVGPVTNEMDFTGSAVPQYWQDFYSLASSTQFSGQGTLAGNGATPPDRFVIAAWPRIFPTLHDFTVDPTQSVTSDSAVAMYWNPTALAPGASVSYTTLYGLSGFTQDLSPPLALSLTAPASLSAQSGSYSPNPFTVSAVVQNVGGATATASSLTLNLPAGLSLAAGQTASQSVGDLAPGASAEVSWQVIAAPQATATSLTYSVTATASNATTKTLDRSISLPALSGGCAASPPSGVQNQSLASGGANLGHVQVAWQPGPAGCEPVDHYEIVNIQADGSVGPIVGTVPETGSSTYADSFTHLNMCTFYRYGVYAVGQDGRRSTLAQPASPAFTSGPPLPNPPTVTIVIQGVGSSLPGGVINPTHVSNCSSLTGYDTDISRSTPLGSMAFAWLNADQVGLPSYAGGGAGNNLIDDAASKGGLVIPLSYGNGAETEEMLGTAANARLLIPDYTSSNVSLSPPPAIASRLEFLITTIETVFPNAKIVIVGHSNGGLIAQRWWAANTTNAPGPQQHVVQVFSLDSPINGVWAGTVCSKDFSNPLCAASLGVLGTVSPGLLRYYGDAWLNQAKASNDPRWLRLDNANKMWTAGFTDGDPLYDAADYGAVSGLPGDKIGVDSQALVSSNCPNLHWQTGCTPVGRYIDSTNRPGGPYDDGAPPLFNLPGDIWIHSAAKNQPLYLAAIMRYIQ